MFKRAGAPNQIVCAMAYLLKHETWSESGHDFIAIGGPKEIMTSTLAPLDLENSSHCHNDLEYIIDEQ